jgi:hypothetical protein
MPSTTYGRTENTYIRNNDIMLISEMHFNEESYLKLPNYTVYHTNHLARTARGGTGKMIIKIPSSITN